MNSNLNSNTSVITLASRSEFFPNKSILEIRDVLEVAGLDRHMSIEAEGTECAISVSGGILLQNRNDGMLGMWGGEFLPNLETPVEGVIREVREETALLLDESTLIYRGEHTHLSVYPNGDQVYYHSYRFKTTTMIVTPELFLNSESTGFTVLHSLKELEKWNSDGKIFFHQIDFLREIVLEI